MPRSQCTSAAFVAAGAGARTCHATRACGTSAMRGTMLPDKKPRPWLESRGWGVLGRKHVQSAVSSRVVQPKFVRGPAIFIKTCKTLAYRRGNSAGINATINRNLAGPTIAQRPKLPSPGRRFVEEIANRSYQLGRDQGFSQQSLSRGR
jgi:hypothetical protein